MKRGNRKLTNVVEEEKTNTCKKDSLTCMRVYKTKELFRKKAK